MTLSAHLQSTLSALYLGKAITGPDWDPRPFVVRAVDVGDDWGETEVVFWSHPAWYPAPPPEGLRSYAVRLYGEMPTVLWNGAVLDAVQA